MNLLVFALAIVRAALNEAFPNHPNPASEIAAICFTKVSVQFDSYRLYYLGPFQLNLLRCMCCMLWMLVQ